MLGPTAQLAKALELAVLAHLGSFDKAGRPYLAHPLRMAARALDSNLPIKVAIVAALHDTVEDTEVELDMLARHGFPPDVVAAIDAISKRAGESYTDYLARVRANQIARAVKLLDLDDNIDPHRLTRLRASEAARLTTKYVRARAFIEES